MTATTLHHNYNSTTLQLRLQLPYTTLHPAVVCEVTTATIATTPRDTPPTTYRIFRSISGFALPSVIHNNIQQPTSPIGFLFWNFRHRLVRYYWYLDIEYIWTNYSTLTALERETDWGVIPNDGFLLVNPMTIAGFTPTIPYVRSKKNVLVPGLQGFKASHKVS